MRFVVPELENSLEVGFTDLDPNPDLIWVIPIMHRQREQAPHETPLRINSAEFVGFFAAFLALLLREREHGVGPDIIKLELVFRVLSPAYRAALCVLRRHLKYSLQEPEK